MRCEPSGSPNSLDVGEQRAMEILVGVRDELEPDEILALEMTLSPEDEAAVGSLGVVVRG
jgi:hypothetical protein